MNISARAEYACLAVMQLAGSYGTGTPVRVATIAQTHGIPSHFLVQILLQLKNAGLVASTRGAGGGYQLIRDPAEITLADVLRVIDGSGADVRRNCGQETVQARVLLGVWTELTRLQQDLLENSTIESLLDRATSEADPMYYI